LESDEGDDLSGPAWTGCGLFPASDDENQLTAALSLTIFSIQKQAAAGLFIIAALVP
jgi:hypothetical protein